MWLLLVVWVIGGDLDISYRLQPSQVICEARLEQVENHLYTYGNNIEYWKASCIKLEE